MSIPAFHLLKNLFAFPMAFSFLPGGALFPRQEQYRSSSKQTCVGLFSHSDQQTGAQTLQCQTPGNTPRGAGGRMADALNAQNPPVQAESSAFLRFGGAAFMEKRGRCGWVSIFCMVESIPHFGLGEPKGNDSCCWLLVHFDIPVRPVWARNLDLVAGISPIRG